MQSRQKKYSYIYRIYRKLRYLRYARKQRKKALRIDRLEKRKEERERNKLLKDKARTDKINDRNKRRAELEDIRDRQEVIRKEIESDQTAEDERIKALQEIELESLKKESIYRKRARRRVIRIYKKACKRNTLRIILAFNPLNIPRVFRLFRKNKRKNREFAIILLHSTVLFTAAYFLVFLVGMLISAISGLFFDYKSIIYYNEVLWLVKTEQWFGDSVKSIYASAPILLGIISIFLTFIYTYLRTEKGLIKLFLLWCILHGYNSFFGSLLLGSIFGKGMGHAIMWSYTSDSEKVIYSILAITALVLLGVFTTRSFLLTANSYYSKLKKVQFGRFILAQVILPFIIGSGIIASIMSPGISIHDYTVALALAITIIPIALRYRYFPALYFEEEDIKIELKFRKMLYALLFIALYRIILSAGIPMG
jgi:hypothetical protein